MDECGGLENRWAREGLVGSNPTLSATPFNAVWDLNPGGVGGSAEGGHGSH